MKLLILLNKNKPAVSETFIQIQIQYFNATSQNIYKYTTPYSEAKISLFTRIFFLIKKTIGAIKFFHYVKKNKIDVVLAQYGMVGADAVFFCKLLKLPLIVHFHGHDAHRKNIIEKYQPVYEKMFKYVSSIIVVSTKMQQKLLEMGAPKDKIFLNVYGVDLDENQQPNNGKNCLAVGRFVDKKAPYLSILAFEKVLKVHPNATLTFVGTGYLFETCKRIIVAKKLENSILLLGEQSNQQVKNLMKEHGIFIQHSVEAFDGDSEGTPVSLLEACSFGMAVIVTRHAGMEDVIKNNVNGLLIEEGDLDSMAENIIQLLEDPTRCNRLGYQAKETIRNNYTTEKSLQTLQSVVESIFKKDNQKK